MQWPVNAIYIADWQVQDVPPWLATPAPTPPPLPTHAASVEQMLMADSASVALSATDAGSVMSFGTVGTEASLPQKDDSR